MQSQPEIIVVYVSKCFQITPFHLKTGVRIWILSNVHEVDDVLSEF